MLVVKLKKGQGIFLDDPGLVRVTLLETGKKYIRIGVDTTSEFAFCHDDDISVPTGNELQPRAIPIEADDWVDEPVKIRHSLK